MKYKNKETGEIITKEALEHIIGGEINYVGWEHYYSGCPIVSEDEVTKSIMSMFEEVKEEWDGY